MANNVVSTKFKLRFDTETNWINSNPVLLENEFVVVSELGESKNKYRFKIGDGYKKFMDLPYFNFDNIDTDNVKSKSIDTDKFNTTSVSADNIQSNTLNVKNITAETLNVPNITTQHIQSGLQTSAESIGAFATGLYSKANSPASISLGSFTDAVHNYSVVWNGDIGEFNFNKHLQSKGEGTFTINPVGDINGFYIGDKSLSAILSENAGIKEETDPTVPAWAKESTKPTYNWSEITNKPGTFTPSEHTHTIANITGLQTELNNKQPKGEYILKSELSDYVHKDELSGYAPKNILNSVTDIDPENTSIREIAEKINEIIKIFGGPKANPPEDFITQDNSDGTVSITGLRSGVENSEKLVVPAEINGKQVRDIIL